MGLGDVLFGRKKLKGAKLDRLFALSTAQVTLDVELGFRSAGVAAAVVKPLSAGAFARAEQDIDELLGVVKQTSGSDVRRREDSLGYNWFIVRDKDFEDLVTGVHVVASELVAKGFGERLLVADFAFRGRDRELPAYLIFNFKQGTFYPFVPTEKEQERDNAEELRLSNELKGELPIEPDLSRWFPLFDPPFEDF